MPLPAPSKELTALVTGASSGIGEAIARDLARRGHGLTLVARSEGKLEDLAAELRSDNRRVEVLAADLSERDARAALPGRVAALGLELSILVNNAGLSTLGSIAESKPATEMYMVEVDVMAVVDLTCRFLPSMVERGSGGVLNVASTAAFQPLPGQAGYGASKAFVLSFTESVHGELLGSGVTATALCPGPVDTGFGEAAGFNIDDAESALPSFMWESPEKVARIGVDALAAGRAVAVAGTANRAAAAMVRFVPHRLLVPLLAKHHPALRRK